MHIWTAIVELSKFLKIKIKTKQNKKTDMALGGEHIVSDMRKYTEQKYGSRGMDDLCMKLPKIKKYIVNTWHMCKYVHTRVHKQTEWVMAFLYKIR